MSVNYNSLNTSEKALITKVLNAKTAVISSSEYLKQVTAKAFELVKSNGSITKGNAHITLVPECERKGFDYKRLKSEHPELELDQYITKTTVREHIEITGLK